MKIRNKIKRFSDRFFAITQKFIVVFLYISIALCFVLPVLALDGEIQDNFETGGTIGVEVFDTGYCRTQTFTASSNYDITGVWLYLKRTVGLSWTCVFVISEGDSTEWWPYGGQIAVKYFDASEITTAWGWVEIELDTPVSISQGVEYALQLRGYTIDTKKLEWYQASGNQYADGSAWYATTADWIWNEDPTHDLYFRVWGTPSGPVPIGVESFDGWINEDDTMTLIWTKSETADGVRLVRGYPDPVTDKDMPVNVYQGTADNYTDCCLPTYAIFHYSIWEYNEIGWSENYSQLSLGGENVTANFTANITLPDPFVVNLEFPIALYIFLFGLFITFIAFFIKSPFLSFAVFCAMIAVMVQPEFKDNTWMMWSTTAILAWSMIATVKRFMDMRSD